MRIWVVAPVCDTSQTTWVPVHSSGFLSQGRLLLATCQMIFRSGTTSATLKSTKVLPKRTVKVSPGCRT
jgi:hypothetical protein